MLLNPIVRLGNTSYSDNGTEVRLKLWMYNYDGGNAHFIGDVYLNIDGSNVVKLNDIWRNFSNVDNEDHIKNLETSGNMGLQGTMKLNNVKIGTAQFCNVKKNQTCAYNDNPPIPTIHISKESSVQNIARRLWSELKIFVIFVCFLLFDWLQN